MLPSENRCTRKVISFVHDFNDELSMPHRSEECCLRMLPSKMRCFDTIVELVYEAPVSLRMLPSEICCTHKVIDFVHDLNAPVSLKILPSGNRCTRKVISFVHDFNDGLSMHHRP